MDCSHEPDPDPDDTDMELALHLVDVRCRMIEVAARQLTGARYSTPDEVVQMADVYLDYVLKGEVPADAEWDVSA